MGEQSTNMPNSPQELNISTFKNISAFVLETAQNAHLIKANIKYVKNAKKAHSDLIESKTDLVFMSYDDTLSMAIENDCNQIAAVAPIHGGILSLCGEINLTQNKTKIGIDTNTGYARALRFHLHQLYPTDLEYNQLHWLFEGATNLRVIDLLNGETDASLLNPPYSYKNGVARMIKMSEAIGNYQGVVINLNKAWLANPSNAANLAEFIRDYYQRVNEIQANPTKTILKLVNYYGISASEASNTHARLWESDGLSLSSVFNQAELRGTQSIFSWDRKRAIPESCNLLLQQVTKH